MQLEQFTQAVYLQERALRHESQRQILMSIRWFINYAGNLSLGQLSHTQLNSWATDNPQQWSPKTLKRRVQDVLAVWTYAYQIGMTDNQPNRLRVRPVRVPAKLPVAWTLDDLHRMLCASQAFQEYLPNGVPRCALLRAVICVGFYSALRAADLMALYRHELSARGTGIAQAKKAGTQVFVRVPQWCIDEIDKSYPADVAQVWAWPFSAVSFYTLWRRMLETAKLPTGKREGLQKLRRTAVSYGELLQQGFGARLAGHTPGSSVTYKNYVDPTILNSASDLSLPDLRSTRNNPDSDQDEERARA